MESGKKLAKKSSLEFRGEKSDQELRTIWLASRSNEQDQYWMECGVCFKPFPCDCQFKDWKRNMSWEEHDEIVTSSALDKTTIKFCTNCGSSKIDKFCGVCGTKVMK